jgi:hypothetical protein
LQMTAATASHLRTLRREYGRRLVIAVRRACEGIEDGEEHWWQTWLDASPEGRQRMEGAVSGTDSALPFDRGGYVGCGEVVRTTDTPPSTRVRVSVDRDALDALIEAYRDAERALDDEFGNDSSADADAAVTALDVQPMHKLAP